MEVALERCPHLVAALDQRPEGGLELGEALGQHAVDRVGDHARRARPDPRQLGQGAGRCPVGDLVGRQREDHGGGVAEGLDPAGLFAAALHQERDPAQGRDRSALVRCPPSPRTFFSPHPVDERWRHRGWSAAGTPARRRRYPQPKPPRGYLSTAPAPVPGASPQVYPQAVHRRHAGRVDPVTGARLALRADGAPSSGGDVRKGKANVAERTGSPFFLPSGRMAP